DGVHRPDQGRTAVLGGRPGDAAPRARRARRAGHPPRRAALPDVQRPARATLSLQAAARHGRGLLRRRGHRARGPAAARAGARGRGSVGAPDGSAPQRRRSPVDRGGPRRLSGAQVKPHLLLAALVLSLAAARGQDGQLSVPLPDGWATWTHTEHVSFYALVGSKLAEG